MFLKRIDLLHFKNYDKAKLHFVKKVNLFYGDNGSGKTNLLDAIYYCCISKSYFGLSDRDIQLEGQDVFKVEGWLVDDQGDTDHMVIKYRDGKKKRITCNDVPFSPASEIIGKYPIVFIAPDDIRIVKDDSRHRRNFVDRILCQSNFNYMAHLVEYNRAMKQKNALLKRSHHPDVNTVKAINQIKIRTSKYLRQNRSSFVSSFAPIMAARYDQISDTREDALMTYRSQFSEDITRDFKSVLQEELEQRRILLGVHKDDFEFDLNGRSLKKFGSQGQIKSFLYALRWTEYEYLKEQTGKKPILLMDDFFEKLDGKRMENLLTALNSDTFGQVFLSDTEKIRSREILQKHGIDFASFAIKEGTILEMTA